MHNNERRNHTDDLVEFIRAWDEPEHELNTTTVQLKFTPEENINATGVLGEYSGYALTRHHPLFERAVERPVLPLVNSLVDRGWITYSSCAGHYYSTPGIAPVERHVGLVARSQREFDQILQALVTIAKRLDLGIPQPMRLAVRLVPLEGGDQPTTAIELWLEKTERASWEAYFEYLDAFCEVVQLMIGFPSAIGSENKYSVGAVG
jgi:uncharacterized protein